MTTITEEVLTPCNALNCQEDNSCFQNTSAYWLDDYNPPNVGHRCEYSVVHEGDVLPDGKICHPIEGGACIMIRPAMDPANPGHRLGFNFYPMYLNPHGNWDLRRLERLHIRFFTNHPEVPINIALACQPWKVYGYGDFYLGEANIHKWTESDIDMRTSPAGSPDFTAGKAITLYVHYVPGEISLPSDEYYLLIDLITVEPPEGIVPLGTKVAPSSAFMLKDEELTFTGTVWGGYPQYQVSWLLNGEAVKTELLEQYVETTYNFKASKVGDYTLQIKAVDNQGQEVYSNIAAITVSETLPPAVPCRPLHVSGNQILTDLGQPVHLHGVHLHGFLTHPYGNWIDRDGNYHYGDHFASWAEVYPVMIQELDGLREWGVTNIRTHLSVELWINNINGCRENYKSFLAECNQRGIYVTADFYSIRYWMQPGDRPTPIPFPPYLNSDELAATGWTSMLDFAEFWRGVANELRGYVNVIFELWNEPNGDAAARDAWFSATQLCIDAIRATGAKQPIVAQWGYAVYWNYTYNNGETLDWVYDYPLTDPLGNIIYSTHMYRFYGHLGYYGTYGERRCVYKRGDILQTLINTKILEVAKSYPLYIGEIGCYWGDPRPAPDDTDPLEAEYAAWKNIQDLLVENKIHFNAYVFWCVGFKQSLVNCGVPNYQPNEAGQILVNTMREYVAPPPKTIFDQFWAKFIEFSERFGLPVPPKPSIPVLP